LKHIMNLVKTEKVYPQVNAIALAKINTLIPFLKKNTVNVNETMYNAYYLNQINTFLEKPESFKVLPTSPKIPDGSPIGSFICNF
ncbi:peptidase, partial [Aquimarina celericrescens]|nr:peptidase [Aquimarina celericrescens]